MSTLKTSISTLAVVAALSIALASPCYAQSAGGSNVGAPGAAGIGAQEIADAVKKRDEQLAKLDQQERQRLANLEKQKQQQTTGTSSTGRVSGFVTPPAEEKPEEPGIVESCWNGICSFFKSVANAVTGDSDNEAEEYKKHVEEVHKEAAKIAAEKAKSQPTKAPEPQKNTEPQKTAGSNSTELKTVERKTVETKSRPEIVRQAPVINTHQVEASRVEISRPTVNVAHPTINLPHPTVNVPAIHVPTIQIPSIVAHR